ncbi:sugar phosphate isomerase/epimerase [Pedobacter sp. SYP-B3415]|uniref:sugar phosphate isomerase/epimerase family protein n=1 Tax=Pedobacter sp. SYP-B3415 TaxID=2496641 RepID=UPI00101B9FA5|nr:TIM barrel protein [Pedobacter sp. SYP-B3415]
MSNRRTFIKNAALLGGAFALAGPLAACSKAKSYSPVKEIGLQLFSIRDALAADVTASLRKVAEIGYNHVETFFEYNKKKPEAKFWGLEVSDLKKLLADNRLASYSGHYQLHDFLTRGNGDKSALEYQVDIAASLGQQYFIIPVPPLGLLDMLSADDFKFMAEQFNKAGELCRKSGLTIGYHNHFWEFRSLAGGKKGMDILLSETEPDLVTFELDLFWAKKSGINPDDYFKKYPGRFAMWHVKDMDKSNTEPITGGEQDKKPSMDILQTISYTEVGTGAIDFKEIFSHQEQSGLKHLFVEQDVIKQDVFKSIKQSFDYVKKNLVS